MRYILGIALLLQAGALAAQNEAFSVIAYYSARPDMEERIGF